MGLDAAMRVTMTCEQVGEFMKQCSVDLFLGNLAQRRIEPYFVSA
jgi:hypothetical protein